MTQHASNRPIAYVAEWRFLPVEGEPKPGAHVKRLAFRGRREVAILGPHDAAGTVAAEWLLLRGYEIEARVRLRVLSSGDLRGEWLWVTEPVLGALES